MELETYARILMLEKTVKKLNYRIYLLEKGKDLKSEAKTYFEGANKVESEVQLDLLKAIGD